MSEKARRIEPKFVAKVWGSTVLEPWFPNSSERIGEVWFPAGDLLIKFLFTTERLSVQVHPDDEYAALHEKSRGKTEMWYILRAAADATVALGFKEPVEPALFREAALSGEIVNLLDWIPARAGDTFFTPAGTVHAIGAGLALCEIQQNSDVTYRIFDYGRQRELHLERAMEVSDFGRWACIHTDPDVLVECPYFVTRRMRIDAAQEIRGGGYAIVLEGSGELDGQGFGPGTVWELSEAARVVPDGVVTALVTG
jgi:mannose-6-phosphate isomerase